VGGEGIRHQVYTSSFPHFSISSNLSYIVPSSKICWGYWLRDYVCGTLLDEKTAKFRINFEGETYYFCSASCKKKFKRHPKKFVK